MTLYAKVLLTLVLVLFVGLGSAALIASRGADAAATTYAGSVVQQQAAGLAEQAGLFYAQGRSWDAVQEWLDSVSTMGMMGQGMGQGMMGQGMMRGQQHLNGRTRAYTLVEPETGRALASLGEAVSGETLAAGLPVHVGNNVVALLAPVRLPAGLVDAESIFRNQLNGAILLAALAAGVVALVAGAFLVSSILRPLKRVERAVDQIARGQLETRISPLPSDEIGRLGAGVNQMASSLQEQEVLRQRMVSDIAHELRTPLSVLQGNLQAMLDDVYPLEKAEVRVLFDETRLLTRLVSDLHELAQAEARRLPLALQRVESGGVLATVAELFRATAEANGVTLRVEDGQPSSVYADPERLQQVLHNLLGNALRHTPRGGRITLDAAAAAPAGAGLVRFSVRDTGPGVPPADLPHLFNRFYRSESARNRTNARETVPDAGENGARVSLTSGAGLGLAIVKALVEAHGGKVGAENLPMGGARFWFDLPAA